jgi:enoyl-CoA hydratase/carnithine racemase
VNIGFWCHTPQVQLSRTNGAKAAMMMLATGRLFSAAHALAAEIAGKSGAVLALGKAAFPRQRALGVGEAYDFARASALANLGLADAKEGIAAFLEKRRPKWPSDGGCA